MALSSEQVFQALYDSDLDTLKQGTHEFDWKTASKEWGTPLVAVVCGCDCGRHKWVIPRLMKTLRWCMLQGADPKQHAPVECSWLFGLPESRYLRISGHSALSLVSAIIDRGKSDLQDEELEEEPDVDITRTMRSFVEFWSKVKSNFGYFEKWKPAKVQILEGLFHVHHRMYEDKTLADVVLVSKATQTEFRAHMLVLQSASAVLAAMLQSTQLSEGHSRRVEIDTSPGALENFLSLMYTGCLAKSQSDQDGIDAVGVLVETAELARRYKMEYMGDALMIKLACKVSSETFDLLASFACRHNFEFVMNECKEFAQEKKLSSGAADWKRWVESLSVEAQTLLGESGTEEERCKRRRLL